MFYKAELMWPLAIWLKWMKENDIAYAVKKNHWIFSKENVFDNWVDVSENT